MLFHRPILAAVIAFGALPLSAFAISETAQSTPGPHAATNQNLSIHLDPASTTIRFTLKSLLRNVRGSFALKGGALAVNPASGLAQGEILVDATSGKTGNAATDSRMQKQVLESNRYPAIFFHAEHLKGGFPAKDGSADLTADVTLNIHGADHPMELKLHIERHGDALAATTHFVVPYVAWGMRDPSTALTRYSKQVEIDVLAKGSVAAVEAKPHSETTGDSDTK